MTDYSPVYAEPSAAPAPKARLAERLPAPPTFRDEQSTRLVVRWRRDVHGERRTGGRDVTGRNHTTSTLTVGKKLRMVLHAKLAKKLNNQ